MNNDHLHNLPPDADDLSVHAPLLNSVVRGDDFVVPEGYFENFTEQLLPQLILPETSGLTAPEANYETLFEERISALVAFPEAGTLPVPEGYETEITEQLVAAAQLPKNSGLEIPEHYFNDLTDKIEAQLNLPAANSESLSDVPAGYFEESASELPTLLALDNVKQDEGYGVPANYFEELTSKVMERTSAEILADGSDADVPQGYFEELPERILAQTSAAPGAKVIALNATAQRWKVTAVAASVAIIVGAALWLMQSTDGSGTTFATTTKSLPVPNFETAAPVKQLVAETPVVKKQRTKTVQPIAPQTPLQTAAVGVELVDEYALADYAAEQLSQTIQAPDADAELRYYLENTELGDILSPGN
ncbi:MAG: hypothetical protein ACK5Z2_05160 [Bacteroidota bacterium]|jgi:hypothetical protein